ncbi:MAG: hypothetical protein ACK44F_09440 [Roseococcus sp.]|jgi:hypothetical protein
MRRWVPFAVAGFMLTPFALWALFSALGIRSGFEGLHSPVGWALFLASLPLAGLFWIQNLRQMGDSMGAPSRLSAAARLAALLPWAIAGIGLAGAAWLVSAGEGVGVALLVGAASLGLALLGGLAARAPVEPPVSGVPVEDGAAMDAQGRAWLLAIGNAAMALALAAYYWTPWVLLWAVGALVPLAFVAMLALCWWATLIPATSAPPAARPPRPANEEARPARAA